MQTKNETVLIVGGSSGMGLTLAQRCLQEKANVIIAGRSMSRLEDAGSLLGNTDNLALIAADFTDENQVQELFDRCGELDHIVCTAASLEGAYDFLPSLDVPAIRKAMDSKILGPLLLAKHGAPKLSASGSITYTSGIAAYRPMSRGSVVAAINAALEGLARALALELAPIRVNAVSPGWVDTPIWSAVAGDQKEATLAAMAERLPVGRIGAPTDIADAITFLMRNGFTTGSVLHVEGGHRLI